MKVDNNTTDAGWPFDRNLNTNPQKFQSPLMRHRMNGHSWEIDECGDSSPALTVEMTPLIVDSSPCTSPWISMSELNLSSPAFSPNIENNVDHGSAMPSLSLSDHAWKENEPVFHGYSKEIKQNRVQREKEHHENGKNSYFEDGSGLPRLNQEFNNNATFNDAGASFSHSNGNFQDASCNILGFTSGRFSLLGSESNNQGLTNDNQYSNNQHASNGTLLLSNADQHLSNQHLSIPHLGKEHASKGTLLISNGNQHGGNQHGGNQHGGNQQLNNGNQLLSNSNQVLSKGNQLLSNQHLNNGNQLLSNGNMQLNNKISESTNNGLSNFKFNGMCLNKSDGSNGGFDWGPLSEANLEHMHALQRKAALTSISKSEPRFYEIEFKQYRRGVFMGVPQYKIGDYVKVEADRGQDLGRIVRASDHLNTLRMEIKLNGDPGIDKHISSPLKFVLEKASNPELSLLRHKFDEEISVLNICRTKVLQRQLPMKMLDAEFQFDRHKLTFYFYSTRRIDFRELVRDLFAVYKTRIWMQHVADDKEQLPVYL